MLRTNKIKETKLIKIRILAELTSILDGECVSTSLLWFDVKSKRAVTVVVELTVSHLMRPHTVGTQLTWKHCLRSFQCTTQLLYLFHLINNKTVIYLNKFKKNKLVTDDVLY